MELRSLLDGAFDEKNFALVFKSKDETNHIKQALQNPNVAGTVLPDKLVKAKIQGIQFSGMLIEMNADSVKQAEDVYYKRFPFARVFNGALWSIELTEIKMTDNTLGFAKKLEWKREAQVEVPA